jgi:hypothetical protein
VITGFNTDIEYEGVVYHVQTEDKGLETPVILSLVYVGGAILASKRSPYDDLVVEGFDAGALSERLNRQHKLICAAITAGRIEDLKRLNRQGGGGATSTRKSSRKATKAPPPAADENSGGPDAETKPAAGVASPPAEAGTIPATEVSAVTEQASAAAAAEVPTDSTQAGALPAAGATAETDAHVPPNGDAAAGTDATTQSPAEKSNADLPSWFETTAESYASILEKVSASEAVEGEAAAAEQSRRFPPKDALVASGVAQPADGLVEEVAAPAGAATAATDSASAPEPAVTEIIQVEVEGELHVSLMEEREYKAGEIVTLRVRVARGPLDAREAVNDAVVTVKILGTEFRPLILTSRTDRDGVAVVHAWLPRFTSGRAAILVRAAHDGFTAELRRAVRHL